MNPIWTILLQYVALAVAVVGSVYLVLVLIHAKRTKAVPGDNSSLLGMAIPSTIPIGSVYETGGGLQCCCPNCDYNSSSDHDTFIDGHSRIIVRKCRTCGTEYQSLVIDSVPVSGRQGI